MTPAGFPHSEIHGSKPACGSPWLIAAYHVFLRRPVPWHPPCALSNLIVTNLSSCQRIDFSIFDSFFSPETNCKIVRISALVRSFEHIRNWFLYKMFFPSGCAVFKVHSVHAFAIPENDTGSRRRTVIRPRLCLDFFASFGFCSFELLTAFAAIDLE